MPLQEAALHQRLEHELSSIKTTQASLIGSIERIHEHLEEIKCRPAPHVPLWVLVILTVPNFLVGLSLLLLVFEFLIINNR